MANKTDCKQSSRHVDSGCVEACIAEFYLPGWQAAAHSRSRCQRIYSTDSPCFLVRIRAMLTMKCFLKDLVFSAGRSLIQTLILINIRYLALPNSASCRQLLIPVVGDFALRIVWRPHNFAGINY